MAREPSWLPYMGLQGPIPKLWGKTYDVKPVKMEVYYTPDLNIAGVINKEETWTLLWPLSGTGTVHAQHVWLGAIVKYAPKTPFDADATADIEMGVNGGMTFTPQS